MRELIEKLAALSWILLFAWGLHKLYPVWPWPDLAMAVGVCWLLWRAVRRHMQNEAPIVFVTDASKLSALEYEKYCALVLRNAGWRTQTTPRQDQGVDVIAVMRGTRVAIQCKKYAKPVGNRAVQEISAGQRHYGAHLAVVVSPAPFTRSARELAVSNRVLLLHHDQLPRLETLAKVPYAQKGKS